MICFWRYTGNSRNYPGWHLYASSEGLKLARKAFQEGGRLTIDPPTETALNRANNRRHGTWSPNTLWVSAAQSVKIIDDYLSITEDGTSVKLVFGHAIARDLMSAIDRYGEGESDFSVVGARDARTREYIWFW